MDDKNDPKKPPSPVVPENLDKSPPLSREDSLPPFPVPEPTAPISSQQPQQGPSLTASSQPQQSAQAHPPQHIQGQEINLKIKQPNFGGGGSSLLKVLAVFLIVVFSITTFGSFTLAYTNYKFITPPKIVQRTIDRFILATPFPKTTRLILRRTERKMADLKSAVLETQVEIKTESKDFPISNAKITVRGPADFKAQKYSKTQLEIAAEVAMEGIKISAAGQIRQIEDNLYFQLTEVPGGSFLPLDELKNQWFVLNVEQLNKEKRTTEDEAQVQKIKEAFEAFIEKTYEWTNLEDSGSKDTYTLKIKPPVPEINTLLFDTIKILESKDQTNLEETIEKEEIEKATRDIKNIEITLDIDKKSSLIAQVSLLFDLNVENPSNLYSPAKEVMLAPTTAIPITLKISSKLTDYNKPVIVEIPQNAKDLTQYLEEFGKELEKQNFKLPQELEKPSEPQGDNSFRNLLDNQSPVLGEKSFWDLLLLGDLRRIL